MCVVCEDAGRGLGDCETTPPAPKNCTVCLTIVNNICVLYANFDHCLVVRKYSHNGNVYVILALGRNFENKTNQ